MSGIPIDLSPGANVVPASVGSACGKYAGDKTGAYWGGALGGLFMLSLAVTPVVRWWKASCAKAMATTSGTGGPTWRNYVLLSLSLFLYGSACQIYVNVAPPTKYGQYAIIASSGVFGGACFCAFAIMVAASIASIQIANASLSVFKTKWIQPLLVMAWTCHMLALAVLGFGAVHAYTIDGSAGAFCEGEATEARTAMYVVAGLADLVAFFFTLLASVLCLFNKADAALAASADIEDGAIGASAASNEATPKRNCPCATPKWDLLGFSLVISGITLLTAATAFMRTLEEHPESGKAAKPVSKSNQQGAFALPGLLMIFATCLLAIASFTKLKDKAARNIGMHVTAFNLSLLLYACTFTVVLLVQADMVGKKNLREVLEMQRDTYAFSCVALLFGFAVAAFPTLAACRGRLTKISSEGVKAPVDKAEPYKSMNHHFCAAWACVLFALAVLAGMLADSLSKTLSGDESDAKGGSFIAGTALLVGCCFMYYASLFGVEPGVAAPVTVSNAPRPEPRFDPATGKPITKRNSNSHFVAPAVGSPGAPALVDGASAPKN